MWRSACVLGLAALSGCGMIMVNGKPLGSGGGGGGGAAGGGGGGGLAASDDPDDAADDAADGAATPSRQAADTTCDIDRDEPTGVIAGVACGDRKSKLSASLFAHRERGDDGPLVAAGFVSICASLAIPETGAFDYIGYRFCAAELDAAGADEVDAALAAADVSGEARKAFRAAYQKGAAHLADAAPRVAEHEKASPGDKKLVDAAFAEARDTWAPRYRTWGKVLVALDGWQREVSRDGDAAAGCEDRYTKLLGKYLGDVGGDPVAAAQDAIGYHLVLALAVCEAYSDEGELAEGTASLVRTEGGDYVDGKNLDPSIRVDTMRSYHEMVDVLVKQRVAAAWKAKPKPSGWMRLATDTSDSDFTERNGDYLAWRSDNTTRDDWDIVVKVGRRGDQVELKFKKQTAAGYDLDSCAPWYDDKGREHQQTHCKTVGIDRTHPPLLLSREQGALVKKGDVLGFVVTDVKDGSGKLLEIKRGKKVIWLLGVPVK